MKTKGANLLSQNRHYTPTDENIKNVFKNTNIVHALRQPPNLLRRLSKAQFTSQDNNRQQNGLYRCNNKRCNLCKLYIQECVSFMTANDYEWQIRCHITCNSRNVLYYLKCKVCHGNTTYTGKTNNLRLRSNNHITGCRLGNSSNKFDNHVFACRSGQRIKEPYFEMYAFMAIKYEHELTTYETYLHKKGYDTMNKIY